MKSNINNWVACSPNGGSLVTLQDGSVKCKLVNIKVPDVCENVVPHFLVISSTLYGPAIFARYYYYYFDVSSAKNFPVADPCGSAGTNHLPNIPVPSGWIYLRESADIPDANVIHVMNDNNSAGMGHKASTTITNYGNTDLY